MSDDELRTLVQINGWSGKLVRAVNHKMGWAREEWYTQFKGAFGDQLERVAKDLK